MTYDEILKEARTCIGNYCKACPVCNGPGNPCQYGYDLR